MQPSPPPLRVKLSEEGYAKLRSLYYERFGEFSPKVPCTDLPPGMENPAVKEGSYPAFRAIALVLPRRLWVEDLGDALETLAVLERTGISPWEKRVKVGTTCFWLVLNAVREVLSALKGNASSASQQKDRR